MSIKSKVGATLVLAALVAPAQAVAQEPGAAYVCQAFGFTAYNSAGKPFFQSSLANKAYFPCANDHKSAGFFNQQLFSFRGDVSNTAFTQTSIYSLRPAASALSQINVVTLPFVGIIVTGAEAEARWDGCDGEANYGPTRSYATYAATKVNSLKINDRVVSSGRTPTTTSYNVGATKVTVKTNLQIRTASTVTAIAVAVEFNGKLAYSLGNATAGAKCATGGPTTD